MVVATGVESLGAADDAPPRVGETGDNATQLARTSETMAGAYERRIR